MANTVGIPAMSFPGGFTPGRLPIGLALFGRPFAEATMFRIAKAYEDTHPWHKQAPGFSKPEARPASKASRQEERA